jgi:hypothetical protein
MVQKSLVALVSVAMIVVIVALWLRVCTLEQSVDSLTRKLQELQTVKIVPVHVPLPGQQPAPGSQREKKQIFRLIDTDQKYYEPVMGAIP